MAEAHRPGRELGRERSIPAALRADRRPGLAIRRPARRPQYRADTERSALDDHASAPQTAVSRPDRCSTSISPRMCRPRAVAVSHSSTRRARAGCDPSEATLAPGRRRSEEGSQRGPTSSSAVRATHLACSSLSDPSLTRSPRSDYRPIHATTSSIVGSRPSSSRSRVRASSERSLKTRSDGLITRTRALVRNRRRKC